jgi:hypothetical protein
MTQDEIIEMVREAGGSDVGGPGWTTWVGTQSTEFFERFAKLVAAKEREKRTWVGLTTEETLDMFDLNNVYGSKWIEFARTVEAKLKEKNT